MELKESHILMDSVTQEFKLFTSDCEQFLNAYHDCKHTPNHRMKYFYKRAAALKDRYLDLDARLSMLSNELRANHYQIDVIVKRTSVSILDSISKE